VKQSKRKYIGTKNQNKNFKKRKKKNPLHQHQL